jgi:hypothetical protein
LVLAPEPAALVDVALLSGGEDISSCEPHPTNKTETAAIKNINFFIVFLTSRSAASFGGNVGSNLVEKKD